jgi:hypothetical protein
LVAKWEQALTAFVLPENVFLEIWGGTILSPIQKFKKSYNRERFSSGIYL